jgi:alanine-glyoxylate transaminase / serine-glyoxylate transaminase / serine-pyruvate transaminase
VDPEAVAEELRAHPDAKLVGLIHAETSTGVRQPLEEVAAMCRGSETLFVVDAVASLAGIPLDVDALGIDVCFAGSQKCLSVPPGLAPITYSPRALDAVERRRTPVRSWYLDVTGIRRYVGGGERRYHHTAPVNMVFALREGLRIVLEEGLEARWARHEEVGRRFQKEVVEVGLELFAPEEFRLPQVTSMLLPEGTDDKALRKRLLEEYNVEIAGGLGDYGGRMWRVGLMGEGARHEHVDLLLDAFRTLLG